MTSNERSAPKGRLWATPGDLPHQHAISREFALDSGLPDPEQYPSWPNYPDERNLPVAFEARARWAVRRAKLEGKPAKQLVTPQFVTPKDQLVTEQLVTCLHCGKELARKSEHGPVPKFCSGACRVKYARKQQRA